MKVFICHGMHGGLDSAKIQPLQKAAIARDCPVEIPDFRTIRSPEDRAEFFLVDDDHQFGSSLEWIEKRFGQFLDELRARTEKRAR